MSASYVENISESLVREYLKRKGLVETLIAMDIECPRKPGAICNRAELAKALHVEDLMKKNKKSDTPYQTIIEVITHDLINQQTSVQSEPTTESHKPQAVPVSTPVTGESQGTVTVIKKNKKDTGSNKYNDLVLEDTVEDGETLVGEGKAGIFDKSQLSDDLHVYTRLTAPSGGHKKHLGGLSGPVLSNLTDRNRGHLCQGRAARIRSAKANVNSETSSCPFLLDEKKQPCTNKAKITTATTKHEGGPAQNNQTAEKGTSASKTLDDILSADVNTRLKSVATSLKQETKHQNAEFGDLTAASSDPLNDELTQKQSRNKAEQQTVESLFGSKPKQKSQVGDLELGDIDDLEDDVSGLDLYHRTTVQQPSFVVDSQPIDIKTAVDLKTLILGSPMKNFSDEWHYQSFTFCDLPTLKYGLVQKKGGPCGILASVQACLLQELLFSNGHKPTVKDLEPTRDQRSRALAAALATIFWRCGSGRKAVVTLPGMRAHFTNSSRIRTDNLIELLTVNILKSKDDLTAFLQQNIRQFELDGSSGVVLALYSAVLSRTIQGVRQDMDEPSNTLLGAHGYCTQEMVNLFLTGRAVSNVFNDVMELDSGSGDKTILKGIQCRSDIGFLSLFEHYKSCQVGTYYKTPKYAIWVVCSESHFSILFSLKTDLLNDWKAERRFDMYYYDGLARQDAEIRLTIDTTSRCFVAPSEDDCVPPLEHCIRTKWPDAEIDWNGTDPLL